MKRTLLSLMLLTPSALAVAAEETFPGYQWSQIADGIYLHAQVDPLAMPVDGNSIVIVNDRDVFVVDTHINPAVARALIAKIQSVTDKPVTHVVNTHWHDDHVNGNHAFREAYPQARFVAHRETEAALREGWEPMEQSRIEAYGPADTAAILAAADSLESGDPAKAWSYRAYVGYIEALGSEIPEMEFVYPDLLFEDRLEFERGERSIEIVWPGRGNTDGDAIVWLPKERILLTGDVVVAPIPFAFDAPMVEWLDTLDRIVDYPATFIVPGHGSVLHDFEYVRRLAKLLEITLSEVRSARERGIEFSAVADAVDLEELRAQFTADVDVWSYAWDSFYFTPGVQSAWKALGYELPEGD